MNDSPADGTVVGAPAQHGTAKRHLTFAVVAAAAFGLYWFSSFILQARSATTYFGADTWFYALLAEGNVFERIAGNYHLDRVARFHPTTVAMAAAWMEFLKPLTYWITPQHLLKAMFAAVGAVGVWAATSAFAAVIPHRYATLCGVIYATSFGVWYFSSIEESKIVTASLSALYIAVYLQLRDRWSGRRAVLLTVILLLACLNEIVSGFLIVIPIVDTLVRRGWDWRHGRWIAAHGLAGPIAFVIIEVTNSRLVATVAHPEGVSHFGMLIFYVSKNDYNAASLYSFVVNWLFFNIAAPTPHVSHAVAAWPTYKGYFEPALANYFFSPVSAGLVAVLGMMIVASMLPRYCAAGNLGGRYDILVPLMAYTLLRGAFFFIFNPPEPLLFSPAVTLAHLLMISIPFTASSFPAKRTLLATFAALLFVTNGAFIIGRYVGGAYPPPSAEPSPLIQYPPK